MWILRSFAAIFIWYVAHATVQAEPFGEDLGPDYSFSCGYNSVSATYKAKVATYYLNGGCLQGTSKLQVPWSATGTYEPGSAFTTELLSIYGASPNRGTLQSTMTCAGLRENQDPWLTKVICSSFKLTPQGEFVAQKLLLDAIYKLMQSRGGPLTTSFPYDRNVLLAKRDTDLKAEAAALADAARREQHRLQGADKSIGTSYSANLSPFILAPTAGQRFYKQNPVPIKLAPPKGWTVGSYLVNLQRKDAKGNWLAHATIPVGAAQAHAAGGYTGFGAGAPPAFLSVPGSWRLSAQVSYPRQTGWSNWVEFSVASTDRPQRAKSR